MSGPRLVAAGLALLALLVLAAASQFPGGSQGVPGPAVVPQILGAALLVVAGWLVWSPGTGAPALVRNHRTIPLTMGLLAIYALLWRVAPYGVLTGVVLLTFLRLTGLGWRGAVIAAALMATTLQLLFERGLGVRFQ
jgi:hypothetical protein